MPDALSSSQEPSVDSSLTEVLEEYREESQKKLNALKDAIDDLKSDSGVSSEDLKSIQECVLRDHTLEVLLARQWAEAYQLEALKNSFARHIGRDSRLMGFSQQKIFEPFWEAIQSVFGEMDIDKRPEKLEFLNENLLKKIESAYQTYQKFGSFKRFSKRHLEFINTCYNEWERTIGRIQTLDTKMAFNSHTTFPPRSSTPPDQLDALIGMGTREEATATPLKTSRRPIRGCRTSSSSTTSLYGSSPIHSSPISHQPILEREEEHRAEIAALLEEKNEVVKQLQKCQKDFEKLQLQFQNEQDSIHQEVDAQEAEVATLKKKIESLERKVQHEQTKNKQNEREYSISHLQLEKTIEGNQAKIEQLETKIDTLRKKRSKLEDSLQNKEKERQELEEKNEEHNRKIEALVRFLENQDNGFSTDHIIDEEQDSYQKYLALLPNLQASLAQQKQVILANKRLQAQLNQERKNCEQALAFVEAQAPSLKNIREEDAIELESSSTDDNEFVRFWKDNKLPDSIPQDLQGQSIQELYSNIQELCNECHNFFKNYSLYRQEIKTQIRQIKRYQADCERTLQSCYVEAPDLGAVRVQSRIMAEQPLSQPTTRLTGDAEGLHKNPSRLSASMSTLFRNNNGYNSLGNEKFEKELKKQIESLSGTLGYISEAVTTIQNNLYDQTQNNSDYFFQITLLQAEVYRVDEQYEPLEEKLSRLQTYMGALQKRFKEFEHVEKLKVIKRWFEEILSHFPQLMLTLLQGLLKFLGPDDASSYLSFIDAKNPSAREEDLLLKIKLLKEKAEISHNEKNLQNVPDIAVPWGEVTADAKKARYQKLDFFQETLEPQVFEWNQNKLVIFQEKHHAEGKECATLQWYRQKITRLDSELEEVILFLVQGIISTIEKNPGMMITLNGEDAMVRQLANYLYAIPMLYKALTIDIDLKFELKTPQLNNVPDPTEELQKMCQKVLRGDPLGFFDTRSLLSSCALEPDSVSLASSQSFIGTYR